MTERGPTEPSFDPRTWIAPSPAAPRAPAPPAPRGRGRAPWIAGAAALLIASGGGALWMTRKPKPASVPPVRAAAAAEAPAVRAQPAPTAPPTPAGATRRSLVILRPGDLARTLAGAGADPATADAAARAVLGALGASAGELRVAAIFDPAAGLRQVEVRRADGSGSVVERADGAWRAKPLAADLSTRIRVVRGEIDAQSFYSSAVAAGVTDVLIPDFAAAFAFDFDFQREIRPGDIIEAAIEEKTDSSGETVGGARLVYASLQTTQKSRALYRFQPPGETQLAWFDADGKSIVRSLMRTPVEGARISSSFGPRMHPVLGYTRMHKGTDFATPVGTPVYASGDGVVDFMGVHGGHGNYIRVRHSKTLETAYAHLSAYGPGMQVGASVAQGQIIARSGNTGLSSGPHLHYEVIVNDVQVDPMKFETTSGRNLSGPALKAFFKERDRIDALRAAQNH
jgi:murein DD-endopeptidase MepM/ murein hydrolase activator NlpD